MQQDRLTCTDSLRQAEHDLIALGVAAAAVILFVGAGGTVLSQLVQAWLGTGSPPDRALASTVLLNIALLLFGWRRYVDLRREIVIRREAEERARQLAEIDPLTGCRNRRSGLPAIEALIAAAHARGQSVAALLVDIDNFKFINDLHGHQAGDRVLTAVSGRIAALLPSGHVLMRIGGDEFVAAMPIPAQQQLEDLCDRIITAVRQPIALDAGPVEPTVSMGVALLCPQDTNRSAEHLVHQADLAMYQAKKRGSNRHCWFEPHMETQMRLRTEMEAAIRAGIPAGEFVPFYEQQIDLESGKLIGFEMLARWQSPRFGLVGPEVFIPIAEECDLIGQLSESVVRQALLDARQWHPSLNLSINISPLQLRDPWFAQKLLQMLVETGFAPQRLEIEITESCLHENLAAVRAIMASLRNQGIRLVLDDFGTGYSNMARLRTLPFDRIKIDRSFVAELDRHRSLAETGQPASCPEMVSAMVAIGKGLRVPITAEGIENRAMLEALRHLGRFQGQGYLYGQPEDASATRARLGRLGLLASPPGEGAMPAASREPRRQA